MTERLVSTFESGLRAHDVSVTRTHPKEFTETLESVIEPPVIGAPLHFDAVTLPDDIPLHPTPTALTEAATGITPAILGVASYGTLAIQSRATGDEPASLYPPKHVAVIQDHTIVPDIASALGILKTHFNEGNDSFVFATGPSATADMGSLVQGVHGPETVHVIIVITNE